MAGPEDDEDKCDQCDGSGKVACEDCGGTGRSTVSEDEHDGEENLTGNATDCETCDGSREEECGACHGSGKV